MPSKLFFVALRVLESVTLRQTYMVIAAAALSLSACSTTGKIVTAPFKVAAKTTEFAGKSVYHTGRIAAKGTYETGAFAGKSAYYTGKGALAVGEQVYYLGRVPVQITAKALETTTQVLIVTSHVVNLAGNVVMVTKQIQAVQLDAELAAIKGAANVVRVFIDAG